MDTVCGGKGAVLDNLGDLSDNLVLIVSNGIDNNGVTGLHQGGCSTLSVNLITRVDSVFKALASPTVFAYLTVRFEKKVPASIWEDHRANVASFHNQAAKSLLASDWG